MVQRKVQSPVQSRSRCDGTARSDPGGSAKRPRGLVMVSYQVGNYSIPRGSAVFLLPDSTNARSRATNKRRIIVNDDPWYCTPMMKGRVSGFRARVHVCRYGNGSRLLACLLDPMGDLKYHHPILKSAAPSFIRQRYSPRRQNLLSPSTSHRYARRIFAGVIPLSGMHSRMLSLSLSLSLSLFSARLLK
jgi:hypothetical protein